MPDEQFYLNPLPFNDPQDYNEDQFRVYLNLKQYDDLLKAHETITDYWRVLGLFRALGIDWDCYPSIDLPRGTRYCISIGDAAAVFSFNKAGDFLGIETWPTECGMGYWQPRGGK